MLRTLLLAICFALLFTVNASAAWWRPPRNLTWYWQLSGTVNADRPAAAYDIDAFDTSAQQVAALHARGKRVIAYVDVGTWEDWRPDAKAFPASVKGRAVDGWPGERWLDIRQTKTLEPIVRARFQLAAKKGFDAVEPDNMDGYANDSGFPLTAAQQLAYNRMVAQLAHSLGLAVFQKNDVEQTTQLQPSFDGALVEECAAYDECDALDPYLAAGKPVLQAEYASTVRQAWTTSANAAGRMLAFYDLDLDGRRYVPAWR